MPFQAYADLRVAKGIAPESVRVRVEIADRASGEVLTGRRRPGVAAFRHAGARRAGAAADRAGAARRYEARLVVTAATAARCG